MTEAELTATDALLLERLQDLLKTHHITYYEVSNEMYETGISDVWADWRLTGRHNIHLVFDPKEKQ
jgi:hypothetical protein